MASANMFKKGFRACWQQSRMRSVEYKPACQGDPVGKALQVRKGLEGTPCGIPKRPFQNIC